MDIKLVYSCLKTGGVICFPTETVCALSCDATNREAISKIYKIKARDRSKMLSILVPDIEMAKRYVAINGKVESIIKKFSPGPVTYILPNKDLPDWPKSIGIRIPDHPIAQEILRNYPNPLVGTSVNMSGQESAKTVEDIPKEIKDKIDIVIKDSANIMVSGLASTIIDLSTQGKASIIREGSIKGAELLYYYHNLA